MHAIWHEMRQAIGQLRHNPAFTASAVVILGIGLGVTLYMYTVVKAYMLTPLPYPQAERIMHIERANPLHGFDSMEVTQHDFGLWSDVETSFEELAAFYVGKVNLSGGELPERYEGAFITPSAFAVIQEEACLGRTLAPEDGRPGAPPVVVLGYDAFAVLFAHLISAMLRGVSPFDPPTLLGVSLILCTVALLASLFPALRAMRVNPMEALRYE